MTVRDFSVSVYFGVCERVVLAGELDATTAPSVVESLDMVTADVIVDCTAVDFIDSAGFRALDQGYHAARARGSGFSVLGLSSFATQVGSILRAPYMVTA